MRDVDVLLVEAIFEFVELEVDHLAKDSFVERVEDDKAIETVDELRLEVLFDRAFDFFLHQLCSP